MLSTRHTPAFIAHVSFSFLPRSWPSLGRTRRCRLGALPDLLRGTLQTVASLSKESVVPVEHIKLEERAVAEAPKKKGLLETFEEKKLKAKAISSKYHVRESERADFVEPVRERKKPSAESGDIGWDEVFARRSKRSNAELYASKN
jgi:hypothetical protein